MNEYFLIQWEVPKENSLTGEAYWVNVKADGTTNQERFVFGKAVRLFNELKDRGEKNYRLVKITEEVIESI